MPTDKMWGYSINDYEVDEAHSKHFYMVIKSGYYPLALIEKTFSALK